MDIETLTATEKQWLDKRPHGGFLEERHALNEQMGIYEAWRNIFKEYVALAKQGEMEALKRALFLAWYELSEPSALNGLYLLDRELVREVFQILNDLVIKGQLDDELRYMLPYYYMIADYYIPKGFDDVRRVSKEGDPNLYWELCQKSSFDNRGQLGEYWKGLQEGLTRDWGEMGAYL